MILSRAISETCQTSSAEKSKPLGKNWKNLSNMGSKIHLLPFFYNLRRIFQELKGIKGKQEAKSESYQSRFH